MLFRNTCLVFLIPYPLMNVMAGNLEAEGSVSDFSKAFMKCYLQALCRNITVYSVDGFAMY